MDSLAQLLLQSNVQAGSRIIVADTCQGLVLGAVLERMAGVCLTELKGAASRERMLTSLHAQDMANAYICIRETQTRQEHLNISIFRTHSEPL